MSGEVGDTPGEPSRLGRRRWAVIALIGLFALLTLAVAGVFGVWSLANYRFNSPAADMPARTVFTVPDGAGLNRVADMLEAGGLIDSAAIVKFVMRFRNPGARLVPGEFRIESGMSPARIIDKLTSGDIVTYRFTAVEGRTVAQILRAMDRHEMLVDDDPAPPAEGTLLPETYTFGRGTRQSDLVAQMRAAHDAAVRELWASRKPDLPIETPQEAVILASIVERETGLDGERREVAGVFVNRLRRGMRLESDPTIIYGISKGEPLGRGLRRSEIDRATAWNTYQIDGLPPTPIANPGREAIAAVLDPAETDALFFVADGTGGHAFARTYREHLRNVAAWRRIERERRRNAQLEGED